MKCQSYKLILKLGPPSGRQWTNVLDRAEAPRSPNNRLEVVEEGERGGREFRAKAGSYDQLLPPSYTACKFGFKEVRYETLGSGM
ncbi:hypothetical protein EYF80_054021 [Liparis tanakae]|uniref:Uncharacterized protein n=1 Tax=Liparis tanakae TaxID=230148 RepID=A0A4Z2F3X6_9TELE|nr:hypothetical protein EYF80_054021 [Liparis tanakae]